FVIAVFICESVYCKFFIRVFLIALQNLLPKYVQFVIFIKILFNTKKYATVGLNLIIDIALRKISQKFLKTYIKRLPIVSYIVSRCYVLVYKSTALIQKSWRIYISPRYRLHDLCHQIAKFYGFGNGIGSNCASFQRYLKLCNYKITTTQNGLC